MNEVIGTPADISLIHLTTAIFLHETKKHRVYRVYLNGEFTGVATRGDAVGPARELRVFCTVTHVYH